MKRGSDPIDVERVTDVFDGVIYGDLFACALEVDEVVRYSRRPTDSAEVSAFASMAAVRDAIGQGNDHYFLEGRDDLVGARRSSRARADLLRRRARRIAGWMRFVPFVRGVLLTGSVAADAAPEDADVDMMIIVAPSRLAMVFLLLGGFSSLIGRRLFCPNYYLSEEHLVIERRNLFIAHEIAQAQSLGGAADRFLEENHWTREFLPNAEPRTAPSNSPKYGGWFQVLIESPFRGWFGRGCESMAARVVRHRIDAHYQGARAELKRKVAGRFESGHELRFHNHPDLRGLKERYTQHRTAFQARLGGRCDEAGAA